MGSVGLTLMRKRYGITLLKFLQGAEIGFMEIQFDYIRFSTGKGMSEVDFGSL